MRLVVAVLGLCRIDILLAVWLFAVAVSLRLSMPFDKLLASLDDSRSITRKTTVCAVFHLL